MDKYKHLPLNLYTLYQLWKMKCEVIPIVVGCLGCGTHVLKSNLKKLNNNMIYVRQNN